MLRRLTELLWPLGLSLIVVAGVLSPPLGITEEVFPPWLARPEAQTLVLVALGVLLFILLQAVDRRVARRLQVALLLSVMLHVATALWLQEQHFTVSQQELSKPEPMEAFEESDPMPLPLVPEPPEAEPEKPFWDEPDSRSSLEPVDSHLERSEPLESVHESLPSASQLPPASLEAPEPDPLDSQMPQAVPNAKPAAAADIFRTRGLAEFEPLPVIPPQPESSAGDMDQKELRPAELPVARQKLGYDPVPLSDSRVPSGPPRPGIAPPQPVSPAVPVTTHLTETPLRKTSPQAQLEETRWASLPKLPQAVPPAGAGQDGKVSSESRLGAADGWQSRGAIAPRFQQTFPRAGRPGASSAPLEMAGPPAPELAQTGVDSHRVARSEPLPRGAAGAARLPKRGAQAVLSDQRVRATIPAFAHRPQGLAKREARDPQDRAAIETIERGLHFLVRQQQPDGRWSMDLTGALNLPSGERPAIQSDTAATGLVLLAILGAGYDHYGGQYERSVHEGLRFLQVNQKPDGDFYVSHRHGASDQVAHLYSHAIATLAMCEAYGMTGDARLKKSAQRGIRFIEAAQDPIRGGWRYVPGNQADLSVSGWQVMALKSGELAGLEVAPETWKKVVGLLNQATEGGGDGSRYVYNPWAALHPDTRHGRDPSQVMTAVTLIMRIYTGWNRSHAPMQRGAYYLLEKLPHEAVPPATSSLVDPARDTYYWFYATQVMFYTGGEFWQRWNARLRPLLVDSQVREGKLAGSWHPLEPVPDRWGSQGGRLYVTALNLLSLEVPYRHLPLYGIDTPKAGE